MCTLGICNKLWIRIGVRVLHSDAVHFSRWYYLIARKSASIWAFLGMGPEIVPKVKEEALMEVSRGMEDKNAAQEEKNNFLQSASSCQDKILDMEAISVGRTVMLDGSDNMELDVIGCSDNCDEGPNGECNVSTENSSSFGDTVSGTDYGLLLDDEEVESQLYGGDNLRRMSNGYREVFPRYMYLFLLFPFYCIYMCFLLPFLYKLINNSKTEFHIPSVRDWTICPFSFASCTRIMSNSSSPFRFTLITQKESCTAFSPPLIFS